MLPAATAGLRLWRIALTTIVCLIWLPALIFAGGVITASVLGCAVHEGFPQPCMLWGGDIGGALHSALVMGWLVILLLPLLAITLVVGVGRGLRALWRR